MTAFLDPALELAAQLIEDGDPSEQLRRELVARHDTALGLMRELNPELEETAALRLIAGELEHASTHPGTRVVISIPPQEGKTTLIRRALIRKLQRHPELLNAVVSYEVNLARDTGREVRELIDAHGSRAFDAATGRKLPDRLGIAVRQNHAAAGDWTLAGHDGGVYSIGVRGGLTGHPVTGLFVVDDPLKDMEAADSAAVRRALHSWWTSVSEARLGPQTSIVIIQTRWNEDDLAGRLIASDAQLPEEEREWRVVNIPALADGQTPDALADVPGSRTSDGYLVSARHRTPEDWRRIRRRVGERVWAALYQGRPAPTEGGIFKRAWFDNHRVDQAPDLRTIVVGVDPAETGTGDAAGILVAGATEGGHLYLLADLSGQLTQAAWARRACLGYLRHDAQRVVAERTLGMNSAVPDAWSIMRRQAKALAAASDAPDPVAAAAANLHERGDDIAADTAGLREVKPLGPRILDLPSTGPRVQIVTPRASKRVRAEAVTSLFETGRAHVVGKLPELEFEAVTWVEGQPSPNRIDVMAHLLAHLDASRSTPVTVRRPRRRPSNGDPGTPGFGPGQRVGVPSW